MLFRSLARNLGFDCATQPAKLYRSSLERWTSGAVHEFLGVEKKGNQIVLVEARAFLNGNLHLRLAKSFILALNVEHGRLKGWLQSRDQAAVELDDPAAADYFKTNKLIASNAMLLLAPPPAPPGPGQAPQGTPDLFSAQ